MSLSSDSKKSADLATKSPSWQRWQWHNNAVEAHRFCGGFRNRWVQLLHLTSASWRWICCSVNISVMANPGRRSHIPLWCHTGLIPPAVRRETEARDEKCRNEPGKSTANFPGGHVPKTKPPAGEGQATPPSISAFIFAWKRREAEWGARARHAQARCHFANQVCQAHL